MSATVAEIWESPDLSVNSNRASLRASESSSRRKSKVSLDLADPVGRIHVISVREKHESYNTVKKFGSPRIHVFQITMRNSTGACDG